MKTKLGRAYWKLWSATAISNLGDGVSAIAYPWLASAVTRSPILIAAAVIASAIALRRLAAIKFFCSGVTADVIAIRASV